MLDDILAEERSLLGIPGRREESIIGMDLKAMLWEDKD
jgi:hypothetical protein